MLIALIVVSLALIVSLVALAHARLDATQLRRQHAEASASAISAKRTANIWEETAADRCKIIDDLIDDCAEAIADRDKTRAIVRTLEADLDQARSDLAATRGRLAAIHDAIVTFDGQE